MPLRRILIAPDPRLKTIAAPLTAVTDETRRLIDDMFETMYQAPGIGLAAPQIGILDRVVVIDVGEGEERRPIALVNPEITEWSEARSITNEGCLSIPDIYADIERPAEVSVRFLDRDGRPQALHVDGLLATCIQHEVDHLNGVLFIDYLTQLKRGMILRKLQKAKRTGGDDPAQG